MSNLAIGGNYNQSLSAGTIKRFSDNIIQELGEYKSSLSHIFAKNTIAMQGNEYTMRSYTVSHATSRAMEDGRFRPLAPIHTFTGASAANDYNEHVKTFTTEPNSPYTKSRKMQTVASDWAQVIDKAANLDIGFEVSKLAKAGAAELVRLRDIRCSMAFTSSVLATDNTFIKFDVENNVIPLSTPFDPELGIIKFISPFASNHSYKECLDVLQSNKQAGGLTRAKLLAAHSKLSSYLEGRPQKMYCVMSNSQLLDLLADDKVLSSDFVNHKPLTDGELPELCGFQIIRYDYLPYTKSSGADFMLHLHAQRKTFEDEMKAPEDGFKDEKSKTDIKKKTDAYAKEDKSLKAAFDRFTEKVFLPLRSNLSLDQIFDLMKRSSKQVSKDVYCFAEDAIGFGKVSGLDRNQILEDPKDHNNWYIYIEEYIAVARASERAIVCIKCLDKAFKDENGLIGLYNAAKDSRLSFFANPYQVPQAKDSTEFSVLPSNLLLRGSIWKDPTHNVQQDMEQKSSRGITQNQAQELEGDYVI